MNIAYAIIVASVILSSVITILVLPAQEEGIALRLKQKQKDEWQEAVNSCKKAVGGSTWTAVNNEGVIYCISYAGKLLATIAQPTK